MNQTEFRIKAKKISELNNFIPGHTIPYDGADAYLALAYTQDNAKQNYKISLKELAVAISNDFGIDDAALRDKILDMIDKGEIQLPAGPQGPAGEGSTCNCDCEGIKKELDDINKKLDEILDILRGNTKEYDVEYNLDHINPVSTNPSTIKYNETAVFKFTKVNGFEFPNSVEVNTSYTYNKAEQSITIDPITDLDFDTVTIKMIGVLGYYSLTFNTTNIVPSIVGNNKTSYTIYDDDIVIQFTTPEGYTMPTQNQLVVTNATIIRYDRSEGLLTIHCNGTGDMKITAAGQKIETSNTYYFTIVAYNYDDAGILEYDQKGNPTGVIHITDKFYSEVGRCPIDYTHKYKIFEDNEYGYGKEDVYIIMPKKYFNTSTYKLLDDLNNSYNIYTGTMPFPVALDSDSVYEGYVNGEPYVILRIAPEGLRYQYVYFIYP